MNFQNEVYLRETEATNHDSLRDISLCIMHLYQLYFYNVYNITKAEPSGDTEGESYNLSCIYLVRDHYSTE